MNGDHHPTGHEPDDSGRAGNNSRRDGSPTWRHARQVFAQISATRFVGQAVLEADEEGEPRIVFRPLEEG